MFLRICLRSSFLTRTVCTFLRYLCCIYIYINAVDLSITAIREYKYIRERSVLVQISISFCVSAWFKVVDAVDLWNGLACLTAGYKNINLVRTSYSFNTACGCYLLQWSKSTSFRLPVKRICLFPLLPRTLLRLSGVPDHSLYHRNHG